MGIRRFVPCANTAGDQLNDAHSMIIAPVQDQDIQVGDVVVSVAGGPEMTVQARSLNLAYCAWLADGRLHQGTFEVGGLNRLRRAGPRSRVGPSGPVEPGA